MDSPWFPVRRPDAKSEIRLFCLPYAGGSAAVFAAWAAALPGWVDVVPLELPGRGLRANETPLREMSALVDALAEAAAPLLDLPYAVFGHSMGASIAIELARATPCEPVHAFVSAARAPHVHRRALHTLSQAELLDEVRRMGGMPEEVLASDELVRRFVPLLRADFELVDTRARGPKGRPLAQTPITAFGGLEDLDDVSTDDLTAWRDYSRAAFDVHMFPGGHFFVDTARRELLHEVGRRLASWRYGSKKLAQSGAR